jgi:hypothetical protein
VVVVVVGAALPFTVVVVVEAVVDGGVTALPLTGGRVPTATRVTAPTMNRMRTTSARTGAIAAGV